MGRVEAGHWVRGRVAGVGSGQAGRNRVAWLGRSPNLVGGLSQAVIKIRSDAIGSRVGSLGSGRVRRVGTASLGRVGRMRSLGRGRGCDRLRDEFKLPIDESRRIETPYRQAEEDDNFR